MSVETIINRLSTMFGEPKTDNPEGFIDEVAKALRGYDPEILDKACDEVMREATFWPKPAEILKVARRIAAERESRNRYAQYSQTPVERSSERPSPESIERTRELVRSVIYSGVSPSGDCPPVPWEDGQKPAFEAMQRNSKNSIHRRRA